MPDWRRTGIFLIARAYRPVIVRELRLARSLEHAPRRAVDELADTRLERLLTHAAAKVPYYGRVLREAGVVDGGRVRLDRFQDIPLLTKDVIRREGAALHSTDCKARHCFRNTSGGSTGEPVTFLQDRASECGSYAMTFFYRGWAGVQPGERLLQLWGSERDILGTGHPVAVRLKRWLFNELMLNSFRMGDAEMAGYAARWNEFRPVMVHAYVESIYEFARFLRARRLSVRPPRVAFTAAGTLTEDVRSFVSKVIGCPVLNQYGSRETGLIAAECPRMEGLHVPEIYVRVELVDQEGRATRAGEHGEVVVTPLTNYSMPLIRYRIGDTAVASAHVCSCGRPFRLLGSVTGRVTSHFLTREGKLVHGEYFTHLFYHRPWVRRFQVRQKNYDEVVAYVVKQAEPAAGELAELEHGVRAIMGERCAVRFDFVEDIPPSPSGKYMYTVCDLRT